VAAYLPPGWPAGVHPPDSEEFEQTAVTWLLDVVPPDYRLHGVLRRHPYALAVLARHHVAACVRGAREGYRSARTELGGKLPPGGVEAVLEVYRAEGSRLVQTARAVDLVGRALRGEVFTPQLGGTHERRSADGQDAKSERRTGQPDAAQRNASKRNEGERDAGGADAGKQRAGKRDAGEADAGEADAGEADAGEADAGERRTGKRNAGEADAGEENAGQRGAKGRRGAKSRAR
jgi:hypothetical protein